MEKSLMLLCRLLSAVPSPLMLLVRKFLRSFLLADPPTVGNNSLCLEKFIKEFCSYQLPWVSMWSQESYKTFLTSRPTSQQTKYLKPLWSDLLLPLQVSNLYSPKYTHFSCITFFTLDATASYMKDISNIFTDLFQVDQKIFAEWKNTTNM